MFYDIYATLCEEKGISTSKAAIEMGISKGTVSVWKNKGTSPRMAQLEKIADYFHVSTDYLLGKTAQKENPALEKSEDIDIAQELEEMMNKLEGDGSLMFDGNPASPEAILSIRTALEMGLRYAREQVDNKGKSE